MSIWRNFVSKFNTWPNVVFGLVLLAAATVGASATLSSAGSEGRLTDDVIGAATLAFILAWTRGVAALLKPGYSRLAITLGLAVILISVFTYFKATQAAPVYWCITIAVLLASFLPDLIKRKQGSTN